MKRKTKDKEPPQEDEREEKNDLDNKKEWHRNRRVIIKSNELNFQMLFKAVISFSSLAVGGSLWIWLSNHANPVFAYISLCCFFAAILFILCELGISITSHTRFIKLLNEEEYSTPDSPSNQCIVLFVWLALGSVILGLFFLLISIGMSNQFSTGRSECGCVHSIRIYSTLRKWSA